MFTRRPPRVREFDGRPGWLTLIGMTRFAPYNGTFNHTGHPAVSVPAGFAPDGFPLAVQFVGPPDSEARLVSLSAQLERATRLARAAPGGGGMTTGELRALAEAVAREAGALLRDAFRGPELRISAKSTPTDLVSEADHAAEHLIRERIAAARPDDGVLGEEGGDVEGSERHPLGRRPARRHDQLPLRHPAVGGLDRRRGRPGHPDRRRLRPRARRALLRRARRDADARRPRRSRPRPRTTSRPR